MHIDSIRRGRDKEEAGEGNHRPLRRGRLVDCLIWKSAEK